MTQVINAELRASGRTTRLVDEQIQELFTNGCVLVIDHYPTREAARMVFDKVLRRLDFEHSLRVGRGLEIDRSSFAIKIVAKQA
jgi:hypothetical protein